MSPGGPESGRAGVVFASFLTTAVESRRCRWQWLPCRLTLCFSLLDLCLEQCWHLSILSAS